MILDGGCCLKSPWKLVNRFGDQGQGSVHILFNLDQDILRLNSKYTIFRGMLRSREFRYQYWCRGGGEFKSFKEILAQQVRSKLTCCLEIW